MMVRSPMLRHRVIRADGVSFLHVEYLRNASLINWREPPQLFLLLTHSLALAHHDGMWEEWNEKTGKQGVYHGLICLCLREAGPCYDTQPQTFAKAMQTHELQLPLIR
jgi:hypothetical protein